MEDTTEQQYIVHWKMAKCSGLYQILNPSATKLFTYNVFHIAVWIGLLFSFAITMPCPIGFYSLTNDATAFIVYFGYVINLIFANYKMINILYYSKEIWRLIEVSNSSFISYQHYNRSIFQKWRKRSLRVSCLLIIISILGYLVWGSSPYIFKNSYVTIRNLDGTIDKYRMNIFNMYVTFSDETYNKHFHKFYLMEMVFYTLYIFFITLFDLITVTMCLAICCQLETINDAVQVLGHRSNSKGSILNTYYNE